MSESSQAWAPLKKEFDERALCYTRIENRADPGTPDVNVHIPNKGDVWIELKYVPEIPAELSSTISVGLRREQYVWLWKASRAGRRCYVIARIGPHYSLWDSLEVWEQLKRPCMWEYLVHNGLMFASASRVVTFLINGLASSAISAW